MFCPAWIRGNSGETPIEANKTASVTQARTHHVRWENDSFFFLLDIARAKKGVQPFYASEGKNGSLSRHFVPKPSHDDLLLSARFGSAPILDTPGSNPFFFFLFFN
jgi:hypothetical protein